ncbi:MAG: M13 family metallopeptidase, partial [Firmicutes bacterium]|nr:M13 family metallopeptidase [Bacillota bacterium]
YSKTDNCKNVKEFIEENARISKEIGMNGIFPFYISVDHRNEEKELLYLDSTYYIYESTYFNKELFPNFETGFVEYAEKIFTESGESPQESNENARELFKLLEFLSSNAKNDVTRPKEDIYSLSEFDEIMTNVDIKDVLSALSIEDASEAAICDMQFEKILNNMLTEENLDVLKAYSKFAMIDFYAPYLSENIAKAKREFEEKAENISRDEKNDEDMFSFAKKYLDDELAEIYINKYISEEEIKDIDSLFCELKEIYKKKAELNGDISEKTKSAVKERLDSLALVMTSENSDETLYDKKNSTIADNVISIRSEEYESYLTWHNGNDKIWRINRADVEAYYDITQNCIFIPVGLIKEPFYSKSYTKAEKLGGIGSIIAHEIAHSIDGGGRIYSENTESISNNWEKEDIEKFKEKAKKVELAYRREKGEDEISVSTLKEDIADISGMSCIISACGKERYKLRKMFEKYAQIWYAVKTEEYGNFMAVYSDHSPERYRVNTVLKNFEEFKSAYNITENDGMYLDKEDSLKIW